MILLIFLVPKIEVYDKQVDEKTIEFHCKILAGEPMPKLRWRRVDGQPISFSIDKNNSVLTIKEASVEDIGKYECVARNPYGQAAREIELTQEQYNRVKKSDSKDESK